MASLHSQPQKRPGIKRIMTWSKSSKKHAHLFGYENAADDESQQRVPPSPTPSHKSVTTKSRPSLFSTAFARRNSTKSESSRSRSPTSPRLSTEGVVDRTPSPTPSRNSMIFERDIEPRDSLSVHEAIDLGIPPVLDEFVQNDIPSIVENGDDALPASENPWGDSPAEGAGPKPSLSLSIIDNRPPSPEPYEHPVAIADTLRVTTPKELKGLTANVFENPWK